MVLNNFVHLTLLKNLYFLEFYSNSNSEIEELLFAKEIIK